jgi:hypothetical protein
MLAGFENGLLSWCKSFRPDLKQIIFSKVEDAVYYERNIASLPYVLISRQEVEDDSPHHAFSVGYNDGGFGVANIFPAVFAYDVVFYTNRQHSAIELRQQLIAFYGNNPYIEFTLTDGTPFHLGMYNPRVKLSEVRNNEDPKGSLRKVEYMFTAHISITSADEYPEILGVDIKGLTS